MLRFEYLSGLATALLAVSALAADVADSSPAPTDASLLTLDRIFSSPEFDQETIGLFKWHQDGTAYFALEATANNQAGRDLVCHDLVSGQRQVIAPAQWFIPPGATTPLPVEDFALSTDSARLLLYTNSQRVWRRNTRGDYWVLELASGNLQKLGGDAAPRR